MVKELDEGAEDDALEAALPDTSLSTKFADPQAAVDAKDP